MRCVTLLCLVFVAGCGLEYELNSVPGHQLYVGCTTADDCPIELPECRTHRFYTDEDQTEIVESRLCTVSCPDGQCPDALVDGSGGPEMLVMGVCVDVDDEGFVGRFQPGGSCFALQETDGSEECPTVGTRLLSYWDGERQGALCVP